MTNNFLPPDAVPFTNAYSVDVTPELAQSWIDANDYDRPISEPEVENYVTRMDLGMWEPGCNAIVVDNGGIIDGLHRLHAVVHCGKTVPMIVVINEPLENIDTSDNRRDDK